VFQLDFVEKDKQNVSITEMLVYQCGHIVTHTMLTTNQFILYTP